jgi:hypothetical protein
MRAPRKRNVKTPPIADNEEFACDARSPRIGPMEALYIPRKRKIEYEIARINLGELGFMIYFPKKGEKDGTNYMMQNSGLVRNIEERTGKKIWS